MCTFISRISEKEKERMKLERRPLPHFPQFRTRTHAISQKKRERKRNGIGPRAPLFLLISNVFFTLLYIFFLGSTRDFDSLLLGLISPILDGHGSLQLWRRRRRRRGEEIRRLLVVGSEIHQRWVLLHKILLLPPQQRRALSLPVEV